MSDGPANSGRANAGRASAGRSSTGPVDAVVVGGGPNGLTAAIELQRQGLSVLLLEANAEVGGAARTEESTLPGFLHDTGSAIYPLGAASPAFASYPLADHGLRWVHGDAPVAHPLDGGRVAVMERDLDACVAALGSDGDAWGRYAGPFVRGWRSLIESLLDDPLSIPSAPFLMARFAPHALLGPTTLARRFESDEARALLAGNAAHSGGPMTRAPAGAVGMTLIAAGHTVGWPFPEGGAGRLTTALASYFESLGGRIETGARVGSLADLPPCRATLLAVTFRQVARIAGAALPDRYRTALEGWRYGPGAFKVDWALDGPIPWTNPETARAPTVHVGGTLEEIAEAEQAPWEGRPAERPFVLLAQPSLFDRSRAPESRHTAWGYCHVPNGWSGDATAAIEAQVERFAPGFRERILERVTHGPARLEAWDANLIGGDVNGGALTLGQTVGPARWRVGGWRTPVKGLYVCSASTPPGGGVHGMAGFHAARAALDEVFGIRA